MYQLKIMNIATGEATCQALPEGEFILNIGRGQDNDIRLMMPDISRKHAGILCHAGEFIVRNFSESRGTYLNERKVRSDILFEPGDVLKIGAFHLMLTDDEVTADMKRPIANVTVNISYETSSSAVTEETAVTSTACSGLFAGSGLNDIDSLLSYAKNEAACRQLMTANLMKKAEERLKAAGDISDDERLCEVLDDIIDKVWEDVNLSDDSDRRAFRQALAGELLYYGPLTVFLQTGIVSEVQVNSPSVIYVKAGSVIYDACVSFRDEAHLKTCLNRLAGAAAEMFDESRPYLDILLTDGLQLKAVMPPLSRKGISFTVKTGASAVTLADMVQSEALSTEGAALLRNALESRKKIVVVGKDAMGASTVINALTAEISSSARLVAVESGAGLRISQANCVRLNCGCEAGICPCKVLGMALQLSPDWLVLGACNGKDAAKVFGAVSGRSVGMLLAWCAPSIEDALGQWEYQIQSGAGRLSAASLQARIMESANLVVQVGSDEKGQLRVERIAELACEDGESVSANDLLVR